MKKMIRAGAVAAASLLAANAAALEVGAPAPDFTAASTHGEIILSRTLAEGPVVLAYYPADFTPG
jgi:peroxiredoxin Q/BCP